MFFYVLRRKRLISCFFLGLTPYRPVLPPAPRGYFQLIATFPLAARFRLHSSRFQ